VPLQESEVAQAFRGFHDRGLGLTRPPAEHALRPFVVDDQLAQLISGRFLGRYPLRELAEPVAQDLGQLQVGVCASATSRTSATPKRWRGTTVIVPSSIALISCSVERASVVSVGPKMPVGLTDTSSVPAPSRSMKSQAVRSAIALERG
jgi:hypothetical protein